MLYSALLKHHFIAGVRVARETEHPLSSSLRGIPGDSWRGTTLTCYLGGILYVESLSETDLRLSLNDGSVPRVHRNARGGCRMGWQQQVLLQQVLLP